ncbi:MAG: phosphate ABC transporter permease PstA [Halioglobus sp.]
MTNSTPKEATLHSVQKKGLREWVKSGEPMIWANAAAVSISLIAVIGLVSLLAIRGFGHFWPADVLSATITYQGDKSPILGEVVERVEVSREQLLDAGISLQSDQAFFKRRLMKQGNRDFLGNDFVWVIDEQLSDRTRPEQAMVVERLEWGNLYAYLQTVSSDGDLIGDTRKDVAAAWAAFNTLIESTNTVREQIRQVERVDIGRINYALEEMRLEERSLELSGELTPELQLRLAEDRAAQNAEYAELQTVLFSLYDSIANHRYTAELANGDIVDLPLSKVVRAFRPNAMSLSTKMAMYLEKFFEFLTAEPREANTEGGVFPAIFGTVMMVVLMSIMVTPFGVVAAVYLREYAKQGFVTRAIRIAVNNLAGVPSIVYGVFGLGFFIYFLGGEMDQLFFEAALPSPTFGTPGLMWASLTLALLTLPVVIVATEEGLSRIPKSLREGSLALGATRAETLWRVVLPMASPAMMTGLILAVARAAGEVAPLMLVGVVKLAPTLPVDGNYPFIHLDQKFMHLGFHIYDVGFQSPNVEAARPLVYATALLLVVIIALLNFSAVALRNRLRERYKSLET